MINGDAGLEMELGVGFYTLFIMLEMTSKYDCCSFE
jgi:hypothetical protein